MVTELENWGDNSHQLTSHNNKNPPLLGTVQYILKQSFASRYLLLRTRDLLSADLGDETLALPRLTLVASLVYQTAKMFAGEVDPPVDVVLLVLSVALSQTRRNNM
jgi:hypothetical protein